MRIIGLAGPMGCGKSTIAKMLNEKFNGPVLPMAGPLKGIAMVMGWDGKKDDRGRKMLQTLGTDVGRAYDPEIWTKLWSEQLDTVPLEYVIKCDDVRFVNEAKVIRERGGVVIRLTGRNELPSWKLLLNKLTKLIGWHLYHPSEEPLPESFIDYTVSNDGSPESTVAMIEFLFHE